MKPKTLAIASQGLNIPDTPASMLPLKPADNFPQLPTIGDHDDLNDVVRQISSYITHAVPDTTVTYEQLRTTIAGAALRPLISYLSDSVHHRAIVAAILIAKWQFMAAENDFSGLNESRGYACEIIAWQFLTYLSERELVDYLLYEIPDVHENDTSPCDAENGLIGRRLSHAGPRRSIDEDTPLLVNDESPSPSPLRPPKRSSPPGIMGNLRSGTSLTDLDVEEDLTDAFAGMNALEIAAVADAKKFLSQRVVQKIVENIWNGDVIFWESMSIHATKRPQIYNKRSTDPYARLRVPMYQKAFQAAFFISFLILYYAVLVERNPRHISTTEVFLYLWILSFAYDEFGEVMDAGILFYQTDFWSLWDLGIIFIGIAFFIARVIGLAKDSDHIIDISFDILSLEALVLVPRMFSLMSLNPYFGSLIPVLKEMTKAFVKFLPVVVILYIGFLTTFTMLARDKLSLSTMSWILIKVFFGSSYLGFDIAREISEVFGTPLMLIFVIMTNILLITSLISLLSNSLAEVMGRAREEYLFQYSIYVLESSTSRRLTYFMPPLNLIPLFFTRPLRPFVPTETMRRIRILVLKTTHLPFVAIIWMYESSRQFVSHRVHSPPVSTVPFTPTRPFSASRATHARNISTRAEASKSISSLATATPTESSHPKVAERSHIPSNASGADIAELMSLIQTLNTKVEELTSMVAGQSKN